MRNKKLKIYLFIIVFAVAPISITYWSPFATTFIGNECALNNMVTLIKKKKNQNINYKKMCKMYQFALKCFVNSPPHTPAHLEKLPDLIIPITLQKIHRKPIYFPIFLNQNLVLFMHMF
jgi:hypothetical protein